MGKKSRDKAKIKEQDKNKDQSDDDENKSDKDSVSSKSSSSSSLGDDMPNANKDSKGGYYFELTDKKRISVSQFKKKTRVDLREFYEKDDQLLPGKKGISLSLDDWEKLMKYRKQIKAAIRKL